MPLIQREDRNKLISIQNLIKQFNPSPKVTVKGSSLVLNGKNYSTYEAMDLLKNMSENRFIDDKATDEGKQVFPQTPSRKRARSFKEAGNKATKVQKKETINTMPHERESIPDSDSDQ